MRGRRGGGGKKKGGTYKREKTFKSEKQQGTVEQRGNLPRTTVTVLFASGLVGRCDVDSACCHIMQM